MMVQQEVTLNGVVAWLGWVLAILAAVFSLAFPGRGLTATAVLLTGGAAVLHVRGFIHSLACQQRNAFELGRDAERGVRSLR